MSLLGSRRQALVSIHDEREAMFCYVSPPEFLLSFIKHLACTCMCACTCTCICVCAVSSRKTK